MEDGGGHRFRRVVLVGFMGSGKSTVGPRLARALGWRFVDADRALEEAEGRSIPEIFRTDGEERFREIEHRVTSRLLGERETVVATGGGWPCRDGRLETLPEATLSIWLRVGPERAFARLRGGKRRRPLLQVDDPLGRIHELLSERESYYRRALWSVDTDRHPPREAVRRVVQHLRSDAERPLHI